MRLLLLPGCAGSCVTFWPGPTKLPGSCQVSPAGAGTEGHVEAAAAPVLPARRSRHPTGTPLRAGALLAVAGGLACSSVLVPKVPPPP